MKIKGEYKEILSRNVAIISDTCRESNEIAAVYGRFLAARVKKVFYGLVGTVDKSTKLTRTILLTFPLEENEVVS